jgi:methylenetetrahydrofolate reductase (NADPH)
MSNISIELVPRNRESLLDEINLVNEGFPEIDVINIPDLLRFNIRSYQACNMIKDCSKKLIPHIRAIDFDISKEFKLAGVFNEACIKEILVIRGDEPQGMIKSVYPTTSIELVKKIKNEIKGVKIYGGIDQYRNNIKGELDYVKMKLDAGFDGFFTQPFFDIRLFEIFMEKLEKYDIYWGVSPVTSEQSKFYWETKNKSVFPNSFRPDLDWNINFTKTVLSIVREKNLNMYLMPIKIDLKKYLENIFR